MGRFQRPAEEDESILRGVFNFHPLLMTPCKKPTWLRLTIGMIIYISSSKQCRRRESDPGRLDIIELMYSSHDYKATIMTVPSRPLKTSGLLFNCTSAI
jgi:hypothetical protein